VSTVSLQAQLAETEDRIAISRQVYTYPQLRATENFQQLLYNRLETEGAAREAPQVSFN
jgi:hypothetical protein